ncbi:hypothetical protein JCM10908_006738 [Rhodotorula pacifica]|uniref:uncharacterized protein n=1 Tax=Rhodotorula pacifica TaxID=1495444 RepID=UPI00316D6BF7
MPMKLVIALALVARLTSSVAASSSQSILSRLPPSIVPLCTIVNADGSFSKDTAQGTCYNCAADPYRNGAFYCGNGGDGVSLAGYGDAPAAQQGCEFEGDCYYSCVGTLQGDPCGSLGAGCYGGADCQSGYCVGGRCQVRPSTIGAQCSAPYACAYTDPSAALYCSPDTGTCQPTVDDGGSCSSGDVACSPTSFCRSTDKTCQPFEQGGSGTSCAGGGNDACRSGFYCAALDQTCRQLQTSEQSYCGVYTDSCAAPLYCSPTTAQVGYQRQCLMKAGEGASCAFDTVSGCADGLYCTANDQTCRRRGTTIGAACGFDLTSGCGSLANKTPLYCVAATGTCNVKVTTVGGSCTADPIEGCGVDSAGNSLYCDGSVCQQQVTSVGGSCTANVVAACGASPSDGPLYCSQPSNTCQAKRTSGQSCASNPSAACSSPLYCITLGQVCAAKVNTEGAFCDLDPYSQCGYDPSLANSGYPNGGQLSPRVQVASDGNQHCTCAAGTVPAAQTPPPTVWSIMTRGASCTQDPTFSCGYNSATGSKMYCAAQTGTCQEHVTSIGGSCDYDRLGACGITTDGSRTQLYPSTLNGACTCVVQANVIVAPSARARARRRRAVNVCPGTESACSVGSLAGYECIDTESNLEQCGGCLSDGGVDCTAIEGVAAVDCVGGRCEISACEDGFAYEPVSEQCVRDW